MEKKNILKTGIQCSPLPTAPEIVAIELLALGIKGYLDE